VCADDTYAYWGGDVTGFANYMGKTTNYNPNFL
jgi:hypothetical protein